jgi:hypothetical protein
LGPEELFPSQKPNRAKATARLLRIGGIGYPPGIGTITARFGGLEANKMIILGLLLILGTAGLSLAVISANDGAFTSPAGVIELFGNQMNMTVGQIFLAGAAVGALALLGLVMVFSGLGSNSRSRSAGRRQLRDHRQEMQDLQRKHDATSSDLAAQRVANDEAADSDGVTARR